MTEPTAPVESPYEDPTFAAEPQDVAEADLGARYLAGPQVRKGKAAGDWALSQVGKHAFSGMCKAFVRTAFNVVPSKSGTAIEAWREAEHRHITNDAESIPAYVAVYMDTAASAEHVVITVGQDKQGHRLCVSTDAGPDKTIAVVRLADLARKWGPILGWAEDMDGQRIYDPPAKPKSRGKLTDHAIADLRKAIAVNKRKGDRAKANTQQKALDLLLSIKAT